MRAASPDRSIVPQDTSGRSDIPKWGLPLDHRGGRAISSASLVAVMHTEPALPSALDRLCGSSAAIGRQIRKDLGRCHESADTEWLGSLAKRQIVDVFFGAWIL